jgi:poly(3-hydroxybutyrate) depolymerase
MKSQLNFLAAGMFLAALGTAFAQPTLQFSASSYTVVESAGSVSLIVQRSGATNPAVTVDFATVDGTATNGLKYLAVSGMLAFGSGETNQTIVVPLLNDGLVQGTKNFRLILSNPTGGAVLGVGAQTNALVSITDNDGGIQFQFATYAVAEDAGAVMIPIVRGDDGTLPVTVDFATSDLTATNGLDYNGITTNLLFAAQERLKFVPVPILNNSLKQPSRTFRATLSNPAGVTLGLQKTMSITILDNDQGFQFETNSYTVSEDAGAALVRVLRGTDDTNSTATVDVATSNWTATNGLDYSGLTNTLSFAPGERSKLVSVPILNDGVKEVNKTFRVMPSNPTGGAALGSPTTATVTILDNDPGISFERTQYTNRWGSAGLSVTVLRGNDMALGPITVDFSTSDLTAKASLDYQAISGTLAFQENQTVTNFTIPLLQPRAVEGTKTFRVTLTSATGGASLGTASTTANIVGAYFTVTPPFDTGLTIQNVGGLNTISWKGGGLLQRADFPAGPWQTLTAATNPYTVQSPNPTTFYRVARPRPVNLYIPSGYNGQTPVPLVILLHHYHLTGAESESYVKMQPLAEARGFLYCHPDSTMDRWGWAFWNATDACCDLGYTGVDDASYLRGLIEEIGSHFAVDRKRVYLIGTSNGGFMAYRMACQSADLIAGIAALAGVTFLDTNGCQPSQPVNILHIHGSADSIIPYAGGALTTDNPGFPFPWNSPAFPGALADVQTWATYNGASGPVTDPLPFLDLTTDVAGLDTVRTRYTNFPPGGAIELWTINGGSHSPTLSSQFSPRVIDWLLAHPKP